MRFVGIATLRNLNLRKLCPKRENLTPKNFYPYGKHKCTLTAIGISPTIVPFIIKMDPSTCMYNHSRCFSGVSYVV